MEEAYPQPLSDFLLFQNKSFLVEVQFFYSFGQSTNNGIQLSHLNRGSGSCCLHMSDAKVRGLEKSSTGDLADVQELGIHDGMLKIQS
jgi:hypothetical protein